MAYAILEIERIHFVRSHVLLTIQVADSVSRQESFVGQIESAHTRFVQETHSQGVSEREQKLKELAAGYDAFVELQANLTEGTKVGGVSEI